MVRRRAESEQCAWIREAHVQPFRLSAGKGRRAPLPPRELPRAAGARRGVGANFEAAVREGVAHARARADELPGRRPPPKRVRPHLRFCII